MGRRYLIPVLLLVVVLVFSTSSLCNGCGKVQEPEPQNTVSIDEDREVSWVTEENFSEGPEDIQDLDADKEDSYKLEGTIESPHRGGIVLFVEADAAVLNGEVRKMGWYEEVAIEDDQTESSESHHHGQTVKCLVIFNGNIWGKIDDSSVIYADIGGRKSIEYAYESVDNLIVDEGLTQRARQIYQTKPDSFILKGTYYRGDIPRAEGHIDPSGFKWDAVSYSSYE